VAHAILLFLIGWRLAPDPVPVPTTSATAASTGATAAPAGTLVSRLLEKSLALWEVVGQSHEQQRRYAESQAVLQEERLEWLAERDRLTVTMTAMGKLVEKKDRRLRELVEALYKLTHATFGQAHVRAGRRSVRRDGRVVLLTLIGREQAEKRTLQDDLARLRSRREAVDRTVEELASLEESFRLLGLEAESLIQRSLFEVASIDARLEEVDRNRFDARDWERHARIRSLRASRNEKRPGNFRYRGVLVRPVAGPVLPGTPPERPGIYLSGVPDDPVRAPEAGVVRFVGPLEGFGIVVVIEHEHGIHSIVGRVESPFVKAGDLVRRAQTIAKVPPRAGSSVPIYLELRQGREALDPRLWLKKNE